MAKISVMINESDFQRLVELCTQTHQQMQSHAVRSVDQMLVIRNWFFGWYILNFEQSGLERADYGKKVLKRLSDSLRQRIGRGFSVDNLELMRRFFIDYRYICSGEISEALSRISPGNTGNPSCDVISSGPISLYQTASSTRITIELNLVEKLSQCFNLGWSHYVTLTTITDTKERRFYEIEAAQNNWSVRELERQLSSSLYERLMLSGDKERVIQLSSHGQIIEKPIDLIKDPLVLEFLELEEKVTYSENELENAIVGKLEHFLLELGKGFLFEARQKRFTFNNDHFYIDLVFYNRLLRCYVLVDLKRDKLTHQDLGQMQMYVNYFDRHVKTEDELPTIGIVLCHRKNDALVELTLPKDANIFASKYQLYLPSKEELKRQLERIEAELERS